MEDIHNNRYEWLKHGIRQRWVKEYCDTHDITRTNEELDDTDICVPILRFIHDDENYDDLPDNYQGGIGL